MGVALTGGIVNSSGNSGGGGSDALGTVSTRDTESDADDEAFGGDLSPSFSFAINRSGPNGHRTVFTNTSTGEVADSNDDFNGAAHGASNGAASGRASGAIGGGANGRASGAIGGGASAAIGHTTPPEVTVVVSRVIEEEEEKAGVLPFTYEVGNGEGNARGGVLRAGQRQTTWPAPGSTSPLEVQNPNPLNMRERTSTANSAYSLEDEPR